METFDLNFNVQLDPKGPKVHFGFHVQGESEDAARATLRDQLADVVKQLGSAGTSAGKTAGKKAPAAKKAATPAAKALAKGKGKAAPATE